MLVLNAKLFINASFCENSSNAISESQLSGTPIIASNVGGTPSLVKHMETGYLFESKNSDALANGILHQLNNYEKALEMAEKAHQIANSRHNPQDILAKTLACYQSIIDG